MLGKRRGLGRRLRHGEDGFTLVELLVAMFALLVVVWAVYGLLDSASRTLVAGGIEEENAQNARAAMEGMNREIRYAYPSASGKVLLEAKENRITVANDANGNGKVDLGDELNAQGKTIPDERITYFEEGGKLYRAQRTGVAGEAPGGSAEEVLDVSDGGGGLTVEYFGYLPTPDGAAGVSLQRIPEPETNEQLVATVQTTIRTGGTADGGGRTVLKNRIQLANRS